MKWSSGEEIEVSHQSSGLWRPVGLCIDIWEECTASNFRMKELCPGRNSCDTRKGDSQLHRYVAGLHNLLRNYLSSWFMSPSCSLISVTSHNSKSIHLDYLARILAFFRRIWWPKSVMSCHCQNLWFVQSAMVVVFINPDIEAKTSSSQSQLPTSAGFLLPPGASILSVGKKIKFTLEQAMKTQRGSRGIALLFL